MRTSWVLLLVALAASVPDVLPGSEQMNNFAGLCENTYQYPIGYELDKCGRCELPQDAGRTCDCPESDPQCLKCPESPILTGLLLCRLDLSGWTSWPLDSEIIEQAFLDAPSTPPTAFGYYALYYPGLRAPLSIDDSTEGILDCFCVWQGNVTTTFSPPTPAPATSTSSTLSSSTMTTTASTTSTSTSTSSSTTTTASTTETSSSTSTSTSASTSSTLPTTTGTTPPTPTLSPQIPCSGFSSPCAGVCPLTGYDCVVVDGECGCRLPCAQQSVLGCGLGYCTQEGFGCGTAADNRSCVCQSTEQSVDGANLELLPIIGVPILVTVLAGLLGAIFVAGNRSAIGSKHKPNSYI